MFLWILSEYIYNIKVYLLQSLYPYFPQCFILFSLKLCMVFVTSVSLSPRVLTVARIITLSTECHVHRCCKLTEHVAVQLSLTFDSTQLHNSTFTFATFHPSPLGKRRQQIKTDSNGKANEAGREQWYCEMTLGQQGHMYVWSVFLLLFWF